MTDTIKSAQLTDLPCSSCRGKAAVIEFTLPVQGPKRTVYACAMCLIGVIDSALSTNYTASVLVGLTNRAMGRSATEKKRAYRARKKARTTA